MKKLTLTRPLCIIDLESTALDTSTARIVEISVMKLVGGSEFMTTRRLNPGIPIPQETIDIHGITDDAVKDCPPFAKIAKSLFEQLADCDLAGFNLKRFDLKVLIHEFARCGLEFDLAGRNIIDVQEIFFKLQPRDLGAAVKHYLNRDHDQAHSAEGDVLATARVLEAMIERHELPTASDALAAAFVYPEAVDIEGFFKQREGVIYFAKGKHAGRPILEEKGYLRWMLDQKFLPDTLRIVRGVINPS